MVKITIMIMIMMLCIVVASPTSRSASLHYANPSMYNAFLVLFEAKCELEGGRGRVRRGRGEREGGREEGRKDSERGETKRRRGNENRKNQKKMCEQDGSAAGSGSSRANDLPISPIVLD